MTDREKLLRLLDDCFEREYLRRGLITSWHTADHLLANGVTFAKDTDVPSKWINAKDKLPPDVQRVLVHTTRGCQFVATYCHLYNHWQCARNIHITHWMPLPQPPREE